MSPKIGSGKGCVNYMSKIAVIGDKDSILGFKVVGVPVFAVTDHEQAARLVHKLAKEDYAILFITEPIIVEIKETIDRYRALAYPAIIPIPNNRGSLGLGMKGIKESMEKAIGVDILFGERG